jgi:hypothetical protein
MLGFIRTIHGAHPTATSGCAKMHSCIFVTPHRHQPRAVNYGKPLIRMGEGLYQHTDERILLTKETYSYRSSWPVDQF